MTRSILYQNHNDQQKTFFFDGFRDAVSTDQCTLGATVPLFLLQPQLDKGRRMRYLLFGNATVVVIMTLSLAFIV